MKPPHSHGGVYTGGSEAPVAAASISKEAAGTVELRNAEVRMLQIRTSTRTIHYAMRYVQLPSPLR